MVTALLLCGCAKDKTIPPPPQARVLDVTKPQDISAARAVLERVTAGSGEAKKVDAYESDASCGAVADFYSRFMSSTHWNKLPVESRSNDALGQGWRYMSRKLFVAGAPANSGSGCTVMLAIYDHSPDRYAPK
jgi:hypothetical protein